MFEPDPTRLSEPMYAAGYYTNAAIFGGVLGVAKGVGYGAVWPLTLWQACYLYQRDGHVNSIVYPEYTVTVMKIEEDRKRRADSVKSD